MYGLAVLGLFVGLAILGGLALGLLTRAHGAALVVGIRLLLLGLAWAVAGALWFLISGIERDRLLFARSVKGSVRSSARGILGAIGMFAGLLLAGALTDHSVSAGGTAALAVGQPVELAGPTVDGSHYDVAQHRGKVVVVDFWATWCGPCLAELPNLRAVYQELHGSGLEVVGVSFDFDRAALEKFLRDKPTPWPHIFFSEKGAQGFANPLGQKYHIDAIPCQLVIDPEGRLAARDVRGAQLRAAVAQALGKPASWSDRLAAGGLRLLGWLAKGMFAAPIWLVFACIVGGAVLGSLMEAGLRRSLTS
jgi:thiol-disulfide isomerase/thioredoxin